MFRSGPKWLANLPTDVVIPSSSGMTKNTKAEALQVSTNPRSFCVSNLVSDKYGLNALKQVEEKTHKSRGSYL